jgi:hypothetical protein
VDRSRGPGCIRQFSERSSSGVDARQVVCAPGAVCSKPAVQGLVVIGLLIGWALPYLGYRYD